MENNKLEDIKKLIKPFTNPGSERSEENIQKIKEIITQSKSIQKLLKEGSSTDFLIEISKALTLEIFEPGENIMNYGEIGSKYYLLIYGEVSIKVPEKVKSPEASPINSQTLKLGFENDLLYKKLSSEEIFQLKEIKETLSKQIVVRRNTVKVDVEFLKKTGDYELIEVSRIYPVVGFGELALLSDKPRAATITAIEFSIVAVLSKIDFNKILSKESEKNLQEKVNFLQKLPLFSSMAKQSLQKLSYYFEIQKYCKNQYVYREDTPIDMVYFIESGDFQIYKNQNQLSKKIIDSPGGFLSNQKSLLKIEKARDIKQSFKLQVAIRGVNEMLGYEDYINNHEYRTHVCRCISNAGVLYGIKLKVFIN